jgi:hypothetical protein
MRRITIVLGAASALSACASLPGTSGASSTDVLRAINAHVETCERHYQGGLGVGAAFTFRIDCPPQTAGGRPPGGSELPVPAMSTN